MRHKNRQQVAFDPPIFSPAEKHDKLNIKKPSIFYETIVIGGFLE